VLYQRVVKGSSNKSTGSHQDPAVNGRGAQQARIHPVLISYAAQTAELSAHEVTCVDVGPL
jgi:hypothetical protein